MAGNSLRDYCEGLADTGLTRLPKVNVPQVLSYHGSAEEHYNLIQTTRAVFRKLIGNPLVENASAPILLLADFHKRNIFVSANDPTTVSGFIDWQSTSIEPAFVYTDEYPDFATGDPDFSFLEEKSETK